MNINISLVLAIIALCVALAALFVGLFYSTQGNGHSSLRGSEVGVRPNGDATSYTLPTSRASGMGKVISSGANGETQWSDAVLSNPHGDISVGTVTVANGQYKLPTNAPSATKQGIVSTNTVNGSTWDFVQTTDAHGNARITGTLSVGSSPDTIYNMPGSRAPGPGYVVTSSGQDGSQGQWQAIPASRAIGVDQIVSSPDGLTTSVSADFVGSAFTIFNDLHMYLRVFGDDTAQRSSDGINWSSVTGGPSGVIIKGIASNDGPLCAIVTNVASVWTSDDGGVSFTSVTLDEKGAYEPFFAFDRFYVPGVTKLYASAANTVAMFNEVASAYTPVLHAYDPINRVLLIGRNGSICQRSTDGETFTTLPAPMNFTDITSLLWSPSRAEFIIVRSDQVYSSPDGETWGTAQTRTNAGRPILNIEYLSRSQAFVAYGGNTDPNKYVSFSEDCITWKQAAVAFTIGTDDITAVNVNDSLGQIVIRQGSSSPVTSTPVFVSPPAPLPPPL